MNVGMKIVKSTLGLAPLSICRVGEPEEVVELVAFLASDKAPFITDVAIPIDGADIEGF